MSRAKTEIITIKEAYEFVKPIVLEAIKDSLSDYFDGMEHDPNFYHHFHKLKFNEKLICEHFEEMCSEMYFEKNPEVECVIIVNNGCSLRHVVLPKSVIELFTPEKEKISIDIRLNGSFLDRISIVKGASNEEIENAVMSSEVIKTKIGYGWNLEKVVVVPQQFVNVIMQ